MKRTIFIYDHMQNGESLYNYIKQNDKDNLLKKANIVYVPFKISKSFKEKIKKVFDLGILNLIKSLITKDSIVISSAPSKFQTLISNNIICINHGWATKKSPGNNELMNNDKMNQYRMYKKACKSIICLSDFDSTYYLKAKELDNIKDPEFIPFGIPRNDYFYNVDMHKDIIFQINKKLNINKKNKKIFLYAPTHRELDELNESLFEKLIDEFKLIDDDLGNKDVILLFRPHYFSSKVRESIEGLKNIYYVGFDEFPETRDLMIYSDILITDYSSIFIDYLLLNKPIIFYIFDLKEYETLRGLVIDYSNDIHTPGPKINNLKEILNIGNNRLNKYNLKISRDFFHKYNDGESSKRIYEFLVNEIKK